MQISPERSLGLLEFLTKAGEPLQDSEGFLGGADWWLGSVWALVLSREGRMLDQIP